MWDSCSDSVVSFDPTQSTSIGYIIENDLITAALSNCAKEHDNIEVQFGKQVVGLRQSSTWRILTFQDGTEIKTKLLVGYKYSNSLYILMPCRLLQMVDALSYEN